jgi:hypothetical protein
LNELHQTILMALTNRADWEEKQRLFYAMRHEGLRRARKPFLGAADMHYPLVDGTIEAFKPFYVNQLTADEYLAEFTGLKPELAAFRDACRQYFDWTVKNRTDFFAKCMSATDTMLMRQRGILKVYWDPEGQQIKIEVIDPQFFIVPTRSTGPDEDDWFVHVKQISVGKYRRTKVYDQDGETLKLIRGGKREEQSQGQSDMEKANREGLTDSTDPDTIIVWEVWQRTADNWLIREYSPRKPANDLRQPRFCSNKWRGKPWQPFVGLVSEIKDEGWYAPRGIAERLGPFEVALCKLWNEQMDCASFVNRPVFQREDDLPGNTLNIQFQPGEVLPKGVTVADFKRLPESFDLMMSRMRATGDDYAKVPDASFSADPTKENGKGDKVTARQVSYQASLTDTTINMRGTVFRMGLKEAYWRMWALIVQHQPKELAYVVAGDVKMLPKEALSDMWEVQPAGSVEAWNRGQRKQDAGNRFNAFKGDPMINQEELRRDLLNAEDARLASRLLLPQGLAQAAEAEDEAMECLLMEQGFPAVAMPSEDHAVRLRILFGRLHQLGVRGVPADPMAQKLYQQHIQQHLQMLAQMNPTLAKQFVKAAQEAAGGQEEVQGLESDVLSQGQADGPGNVVPMEQAQPMGGVQL